MSTTYYVSQSGDDSDGLTLAKGKHTIAAGIALMSGGDTLMINDGTYTEGIHNQIPSGIDAANRTFIMAINRLAVIMDGDDGQPSLSVITLENKQYITFDGIDVDAHGIDGGIGFGDRLDGTGGGGSSYITFQYGAVHDAFLTGIGGHGAPDNHHILIRGNEIYNCGTVDTGGFDPHALYVSWHDGITEDNYFHDNGNPTQGGAPIHQYHNGSGGLDRNIYRRNRVTTSMDVAFVLADGDDTVAYQNLIYSNTSVTGAAGFAMHSARTLVFNNVLYSNVGACYYYDGTVDAVVQNNINYLNSSISWVIGSTGTVYNYNLDDIDPMFVDAGSADFRLLSGSQAILAGVDQSGTFTTDFNGVAFTGLDIGAFKYSAVFVGGSIVLDSFQSGTNTLSSTLAIPITVAAGANRMLVVEVAARDSAPVLHLGVTFDGVALTNRVPTRRQDPLTVSGWTLAAPNPGTHDVVITLSGPANWIYAAVWSLQNVEQTSPIDGVSTTSDPGGSVLSNALTPSVSDVAILDLAVTTAGAGFTMGSLANRTLSDSETSMGDGAAASILNPA